MIIVCKSFRAKTRPKCIPKMFLFCYIRGKILPALFEGYALENSFIIINLHSNLNVYIRLCRKTIFIIFLFLLFAGSLFFVNNGSVYEDIMESRNLVTAHEMIEYDNWLVPTMNGELRLEKPPLPTWVAAGIEYLQPDNISLQRAAAGIMATLMAFFLYFFASALSGNRLLGLLSCVGVSN